MSHCFAELASVECRQASAPPPPSAALTTFSSRPIHPVHGTSQSGNAFRHGYHASRDTTAAGRRRQGKHAVGRRCGPLGPLAEVSGRKFPRVCAFSMWSACPLSAHVELARDAPFYLLDLEGADDAHTSAAASTSTSSSAAAAAAAAVASGQPASQEPSYASDGCR